jgi:hypothetical protein
MCFKLLSLLVVVLGILSGHTAVSIGKSKVVVFGGLVDKKFLSDLVVYDIGTLSFSMSETVGLASCMIFLGLDFVLIPDINFVLSLFPYNLVAPISGM